MRWAPFNFNENSEPKGMSIDTLNLVAKRVGLNVEYISGPSWGEFIEMLKNGELDLMLNIVQDAQRDKDMLFTAPYQLAPHCVVVREDSTHQIKKYEDILDKVIAIEKGFVSHNYIKTINPNAKFVLRNDTLGALQAVSFGEADLTVGILATEAHTIKANGLNNLKIIGVSDDKLFLPKELRMAVNKNNPILRDILQKGLDSITKEERDRLENKWIELDLATKRDWDFIFRIVVVFVLIIVAITLYLYRVLKLEAKLKSINNSLEETMDKQLELNKQLKDSIDYASLIQHSITPDHTVFREFFGDYFVLWYPKDVVGGDIYFFEEIREGEALLIVADCTGHGVPGAFVTMMVKALEREAVSALKNIVEPNAGKILKRFNKNMKRMLGQDTKEALSNAGFDAAVLYINKNTRTIKFAGANLPLFVVQYGELRVIAGDRESIGYRTSEMEYEFTEHTIKFDKASEFYISTDGYIDQNGGKKSLPFGKKRFMDIINRYHSETMANQQEVFLDTLYSYQGKELRNDDITLIGFRFSNLENDF